MDMRKLIDETDFENLNELTRRWKKDSNPTSLANSQLSQRPELTHSMQQIAEQIPLKENVYHQPQVQDSRVVGEEVRKRQVMPQIIDEDTQHFRNRLEHLLNSFKTDAVSEFMSMKKSMLDYQKESIKNDTHKYLTMYEEKHQELLSAKEKLGTLTAELEKKTMQIELMSGHIAKLNNRLKVNQYLSRPFSLLFENKVTEKMIKVKMRQATVYDSRRTAIKSFNGWRNTYRESKKQQQTTMVQNRVQVQVREVVGRFQKEIEMLKQKLSESTRKNIEYQKNMHLMQDNLKKAFLRGLSSMNMEAMTLFTSPQEGQIQNVHSNEDYVSSRSQLEDIPSAYKTLNNRSMMNQSNREVTRENQSSVFVNKPKVQSKDHKWKEAPIMGVEEKVETEEPRTHTIKPTVTEGKVIKIVDGKSSVQASSQKQIGKKTIANSISGNKIQNSRKK